MAAAGLAAAPSVAYINRRRRRDLRGPAGMHRAIAFVAAGSAPTSTAANFEAGDIVIDAPALFVCTLVPDGNPGVIFGVDDATTSALVAFDDDGNLVVRAGLADAVPDDNVARISRAVGLVPQGRRIELSWAILPGDGLTVAAWIDGRLVGRATSIAEQLTFGADDGTAVFLDDLGNTPNDAADGTTAWAGTVIGTLAYHRFTPSLR